MRGCFLVMLAGWSAGCFPDLPNAEGLVGARQLLAVRVEPPEAAPGETVTFHPLVAAPDGFVRGATVSYAMCDAPRRVDEVRSVSDACLSLESDQLELLPAPRALVDLEACRRFGPVPPSTPPDEAPLRTSDPDETGGYYQPVHATFEGTSFAFIRLRCGLDSAPIEIAREFAARYRANRDPVIESVTLGGSARLVIAAGEATALVVRWAPVETYAYFDRRAVRLTERGEAIQVSWYTNAGELSTPTSVVSEAQGLSGIREAQNIWTAPELVTQAAFWIVVRDSRGGVAWSEILVEVQ